MSAPDLTPVGPLGLLDRAFEHARDAGRAVWLPAWAGGAIVAASVIGVYYVERVEGIRGMRPLLGVGLVLAWLARASLLSRAAAVVVERLHPMGERARFVHIARTALVVGLGWFGWSFVLLAGSLGGAIGLLVVTPLFALRGMVAPSWIARAAYGPRAGVRGFLAATSDTGGRRVAGAGVEALVLLGATGLAVNVYASTVALVWIGRSFVGLDVTAADTFLAPTNTFLQLVVASAALVLLEPLRAAIAAVSFVDARVRAEGLDLSASIDAAIAHARPTASRAAAASVALAVTLGAAQVARAQVGTVDDARAADQVEAILARPEFREFDDERGAAVSRLVERLFEWALRSVGDGAGMERPELGGIDLPGPAVFLAIGGALLLAALLYVALTRRREAERARPDPIGVAATLDVRDREPTSLLDDAARLAEEGALREALRALYLATLVALDRRRLIAFDPHRTNYHYLRQMPAGAGRDAFRRFTRLFDHKWYGREETTREDYERGRAMATEIVRPGGAAAGDA